MHLRDFPLRLSSRVIALDALVAEEHRCLREAPDMVHIVVWLIGSVGRSERVAKAQKAIRAEPADPAEPLRGVVRVAAAGVAFPGVELRRGVEGEVAGAPGVALHGRLADELAV